MLRPTIRRGDRGSTYRAAFGLLQCEPIAKPGGPAALRMSSGKIWASSPAVPIVTPDLPPTPPEKPLAADCCESGCDRCVFDLYAEALAQYEAALVAWRERHPRSPR